MPQEPRIQLNEVVQQAPNRNLHLYGAFTLALIGVATFFFVFAYFDGLPKETTQTAAAASSTSPFDSVQIRGSAAIVVELNSGKILYEKNADVQLPLASLTKVPLALAVSEVLSPERVITIPYDTGFAEGGQRLLKGERWKVRDVMHFTLIASSNEGAEILALNADSALQVLYASSTPGAAALWRMNDLAHSLGLSHTYFLNVSGLDESTTQSGAYGSARDMAKLFAYAATAKPEIFAGTAKDGLLLVDEAGDTASAYNTNDALGAISGLIMGKTGYTDLAGGNLGVVFDAGLSQPIVVIVLGSSQQGRFADVRLLVETARKAISEE